MINTLVSFPIWKNDGREIVDLNDLQKKQIKNFLSKVKSGEYKFLENPCLCGNTDKSLDILVAEKDRYGIACDNVLCKKCGMIRLKERLDDYSTAEVSKKYGANIPFKRPEKLANDYATRPEVIKHTIEFYQNELDKKFDYLVFLQPTSPLRDANHIDNAIEFLFEKNGDAVVSVCELEHPIHWSGTLPEDKNMSKFLDNVAVQSRSQDLEKYYRLNGAIYICDVQKFLDEGCVFLKQNIFAFEMAQEKSVDIDTKLDFKMAEVLLNERFRSK